RQLGRPLLAEPRVGRDAESAMPGWVMASLAPQVARLTRAVTRVAARPERSMSAGDGPRGSDGAHAGAVEADERDGENGSGPEAGEDELPSGWGREDVLARAFGRSGLEEACHGQLSRRGTSPRARRRGRAEEAPPEREGEARRAARAVRSTGRP